MLFRSLNLLLLMGVSALPWATSVVSSYLNQPKSGAQLAVALYGGFMVAHALTFTALWWWLTRTGHLFEERVDKVRAKATRGRFALGTVVYPILMALSFVNALLTLALHGVIAIYYAFNQLHVPTKPDAEHDADSGPADFAST